MQFFCYFEIYEEFNCIDGLAHKKVKIVYSITIFVKKNVLMYPRAKEIDIHKILKCLNK